MTELRLQQIEEEATDNIFTEYEAQLPVSPDPDVRVSVHWAVDNLYKTYGTVGIEEAKQYIIEFSKILKLIQEKGNR